MQQRLFQMARDLTKEVYAITKDGEFKKDTRFVQQIHAKEVFRYCRAIVALMERPSGDGSRRGEAEQEPRSGGSREQRADRRARLRRPTGRARARQRESPAPGTVAGGARNRAFRRERYSPMPDELASGCGFKQPPQAALGAKATRSKLRLNG